MKKVILSIGIVWCLAFGVVSQEAININSGFGMGFHLIQNHEDFGLGLNVTSPFLVSNNVAVRLRGNFLWHEHLNDENKTTWSSYSNISLGVIGVGGVVGNFLRLYGEGGFVMLFPSIDFSDESTVFGGYGLFGFEFFMHSHSCYFIEIGGIGTGAKAEKITGEPIYSNGFSVGVGYRYTFK